MLVDTGVLVWLFRGRESAREAVAGCPDVKLSAVTYIELVQGVRNRDELRLLRRTIGTNAWQVVPLSENIGHRATLYVENHALTHGLRLADALVAATAVEYGDSLLTANLRRYRFLREISLEQYRPEG